MENSRSDTPIIELENISLKRENQTILSNIDLRIRKGEFLGLVGPNGSGKSTLIKILLGLIRPDKGNVHLFDQHLKQFKHWEKIGYVPQKAASINTGFPATVYEVTAMGLFAKVGLLRFLKKSHKQKIDEVLETVGMLEYKHRNIGALSGGQQQRVFIARALVSEPEVLILDEPTVGVDAASVEIFYQLLTKWNQQKDLTLLLVTHDVGVMTSYVTSVACLNQTLHFHGSSREFETSELSSLYGHDVQVIHHDHGGQ
ncbi:metal ABC transporter ATP-binding protein [Salibacterium aidingense]|uniref:metal ABC transporter ATP-binding protein n=1 Tax=Salibacterium aidingense TaxID=384933 RepID=UPI0004029BA6|nr:metal ABC transporter ATP-binding protein [Salibacterium aidingense]